MLHKTSGIILPNIILTSHIVFLRAISFAVVCGGVAKVQISDLGRQMET